MSDKIMKKGVTPVIAIIMLVLIVLVMVGGVFAWMTGFQEDVQEKGQQQLDEFLQDAENNIMIPSHTCDESSDPPKLDELYIRNDHETEPYNVTVFHDGSLANNGDTLNLVPDTTKDYYNAGSGELTFDERPERGDDIELKLSGETVASLTISC
mgnify:FL=1